MAGGDEPYYGIPLLKRPTWKWQIAGYFFFGGLAGASFTLAALADRCGGAIDWRGPQRASCPRAHRCALGTPVRAARPPREDAGRLRRAGFATATAALLPCPVLLIWDLGRPRRFLHMLRVWKPSSPMNLGSWLLTGFGGIAGIGAVHALGQAEVLGPLTPLARRLPMRAMSVLGLPLALGMTGYGGVLLAGTSVPVWNQSPWMGGIFVASSFASATEAIGLHLTARNQDSAALRQALRRVGNAAKAVESALLLAHCWRSGRAGRALWWGRRGLQLWAGLGLGWAAAALAPGPRNLAGRDAVVRRGLKKRTWQAGLLGLAGAFLLRWALVHAGQQATDDTAAARAASEPTAQAPGWQAGPRGN